MLGEDVLNTDTPKCDAVATMQNYLIRLGYDLGSYGADGDFGECTEIAVMEFQRDHGCDDDGEYGPITHAAMMKAIDKIDAAPVAQAKKVEIVNGQCWIRRGPSTSYDKIVVAKNGQVFEYGGETADNGWKCIKYKDAKAWVSGKYSAFKE